MPNTVPDSRDSSTAQPAETAQPAAIQHLDAQALDALPKHDRIRLINTLIGVKPVHLLGTRSVAGIDNLAVFNSAQHIGANPGYLSVLFRPVEGYQRDSYANIKASGCWTLNAVTPALCAPAHQTAQRLPSEMSEFAACGLRAEMHAGFDAPFVGGSPIQIGLRYEEEHAIACNDTVLVIGRIEQVHVARSLMSEGCALDPEAGEILGIAGLDTYYTVSRHRHFPHR